MSKQYPHTQVIVASVGLFLLGALAALFFAGLLGLLGLPVAAFCLYMGCRAAIKNYRTHWQRGRA